MKGIIQSLFLSLMLIGSTAVYADDVHVDGSLTAEQKAQLALDAAKLVTANKNGESSLPPVATVDTVKKWADIGTAIGGSLAASAKELGVAANDFAQSPVGKVTMVIIIWHFIGAQLIHIVFGGLWLLIGVTAWIYFFRKSAFITETIVYEAGKGPNGAKKVTSRTPRKMTDEAQIAFFLSLPIILLVGVVAVFSF